MENKLNSIEYIIVHSLDITAQGLDAIVVSLSQCYCFSLCSVLVLMMTTSTDDIDIILLCFDSMMDR